MRILGTLLLCLAAAAAQNLGRLEGRVVSTIGGPVAKATVRVAAQPQGESYVELTSAEGQFAIGKLAPGLYVVSAERNGYISPPAYRSMEWINEHTFSVVSGKTMSDVEIQPNFLARFNSLATKITVSEGDSATVAPKIISSDAAEKEIAQFPNVSH